MTKIRKVAKRDRPRWSVDDADAFDERAVWIWRRGRPIYIGNDRGARRLADRMVAALNRGKV